MHLAARAHPKPNYDCVKLLVSNGAKLDIPDANDITTKAFIEVCNDGELKSAAGLAADVPAYTTMAKIYQPD